MASNLDCGDLDPLLVGAGLRRPWEPSPCGSSDRTTCSDPMPRVSMSTRILSHDRLSWAVSDCSSAAFLRERRGVGVQLLGRGQQRADIEAGDIARGGLAPRGGGRLPDRRRRSRCSARSAPRRDSRSPRLSGQSDSRLLHRGRHRSEIERVERLVIALHLLHLFGQLLLQLDPVVGVLLDRRWRGQRGGAGAPARARASAAARSRSSRRFCFSSAESCSMSREADCRSAARLGERGRPLLAGRNRAEQVGLGLEIVRDFVLRVARSARCGLRRAPCARRRSAGATSRGRLSRPRNGTTTSPVPRIAAANIQKWPLHGLSPPVNGHISHGNTGVQLTVNGSPCGLRTASSRLPFCSRNSQ